MYIHSICSGLTANPPEIYSHAVCAQEQSRTEPGQSSAGRRLVEVSRRSIGGYYCSPDFQAKPTNVLVRFFFFVTMGFIFLYIFTARIRHFDREFRSGRHYSSDNKYRHVGFLRFSLGQNKSDRPITITRTQNLFQNTLSIISILWSLWFVIRIKQYGLDQRGNYLLQFSLVIENAKIGSQCRSQISPIIFHRNTTKNRKRIFTMRQSDKKPPLKLMFGTRYRVKKS